MVLRAHQDNYTQRTHLPPTLDPPPPLPPLITDLSLLYLCASVAGDAPDKAGCMRVFVYVCVLGRYNRVGAK